MSISTTKIVTLLCLKFSSRSQSEQELSILKKGWQTSSESLLNLTSNFNCFLIQLFFRIQDKNILSDKSIDNDDKASLDLIRKLTEED